MRRKRAGEMAELVVSLGISPRDYYSLTVLEREELIKALNKKNRKR